MAQQNPSKQADKRAIRPAKKDKRLLESRRKKPIFRLSSGIDCPFRGLFYDSFSNSLSISSMSFIRFSKASI